MRMTLEDRLKYGTSEYLELVTSYLGATPECPGGAETLTKIKLAPDRRIINVHLLDWLTEELAERDKLRQALEALVLFTKPTKSNAAALNNAHRVLAETEELK